PVIASKQDAGQEVNVDGKTGFNVDLAKPRSDLAERLIQLLRDTDLAAGWERPHMSVGRHIFATRISPLGFWITGALRLTMDYAEKRDGKEGRIDKIQEGNRRWWTDHTMSYDWKDTVAMPRYSTSWFNEIDKRFAQGARLFAHDKQQ